MNYQAALELVEDCQVSVFAHKIFFVLLHGYNGGWLLQAKAVIDGELHGGGKYYVSQHSTRAEVVQKCLVAAVQFAEHEIREGFTYSKLAVFHPHHSLADLCDIAPLKDYRENNLKEVK